MGCSCPSLSRILDMVLPASHPWARLADDGENSCRWSKGGSQAGHAAILAEDVEGDGEMNNPLRHGPLGDALRSLNQLTDYTDRLLAIEKAARELLQSLEDWAPVEITAVRPPGGAIVTE